jgi:altered-inheritance-of-mitochondria protein 5
MSALVGPLSGALVAGSFYYGFSNLIQSRTEQHRRDLRILSVRMNEAPTHISAPPSAASRITPTSSLLQTSWNEQLTNVYRTLSHLDDRVVEWGRRVLYQGDAGEQRGESSHDS